VYRNRKRLASARVRSNDARAANRQALVEEAMNRVSSSENDVTTYIMIQGEETVVLNNALFVDFGLSSEEIIQSTIAARCGDVVDLCSETVSERRLLADEDVTFTISYDLDSDIYQDLLDSGYDFDNVDFVAALAAELGVDPSNITVGDNSGVLDIEFTVVDTALDGNPIDDTLLDDIINLQDNLDNITGIVSGELNTTETTVSLLDLCGDRTCSDLGTCESSTGVCDCDEGYGDINCGTDICAGCTNGGSCEHTFKCICVFPSYGILCQNTGDCDVCT
jgi:hypothetical protein